MKRLWWLPYMSPEAGGAGGPGGDAGANGADDVSALKGQLEELRGAKEALAAQLRELQEAGAKGGDEKKLLETLKSKLGEYEFRDKRDAALAKAIEAATKDGRFVVDREKAAKLVGKLSAAASLEADVAEIVETIKSEPAATKREPALKGQPSKQNDGSTTELGYDQWAKLAKDDPEAYKAMIEARRNKTGFRVMGQV